MGLSQAIEQLEKGKSTQFDEDVVDAFLKLLDTDYENMQKDIAHTYASALEKV